MNVCHLLVIENLPGPLVQFKRNTDGRSFLKQINQNKMNQSFTLLAALLFSMVSLAAPPTVPASNLFISNEDGARYTISFNKGNGMYRIVVMKEASAVTGIPTNGVEYSANSEFGTPSAAFSDPGEFVVYKGTGNIVTVTNLKPATNYHISVFEFNGTGTGTEYLTTPLSGQQPTLSYPTMQTTNVQFQNTTGNATTVKWTNGNGTRRIVIARKNGNAQAEPQDLYVYSASASFGAGSVLAPNNYVVYHGNGSSVTLSNLEPNTIYRFAVFETNGTADPLYLKPGAVGTVQTSAGPTVASSNVSFANIEGNQFRINFSKGNGSKRLVIAKKGSAVTAMPSNGTSYSASAVFGSGTEIVPGEFVISNTDASSIQITNLEKNSVYHFRIFEYDVDHANYTYYLTNSFATASGSTAITPTVSPSNLSFFNSSGSSTTVMFTPGNGAFRMVVVKEGSAVDATPADLISYDGHYHYGQGTQITPGNYVIHRGTNGGSANIANLTPGKTYHVAVFEYNGYNYPVYNSEPARGVLAIPTEPTTPSTNFGVLNVDGTSFRPYWTRGTGAKRIVIARKGAAVVSTPVDGTTYIASSDFGSGSELQPGEFVVYDGDAGQFDLTNLEVASIYHFAIYDYNLSSTGPDYLTSAWLSGSGSTLNYPTIQTNGLNVVSVNGSSASISFAAGNGSERIFVIRESNPVNAHPQDGQVYTASNVFGSKVLQGDNYIIHKTVSSNGQFTVTGLSPDKTYHVAAFEFNGVTGPAYLRPGTTISFTTSSVLPVTLKYLRAKKVENKVAVEWATSQETNAKWFVVERSNDGLTFLPVETVMASGNSTSEKRYSVTDAEVLAGKRYYRLKQVDHDGGFVYSIVVAVEAQTTGIQLYPNPASHFVIVSGNRNPQAIVKVYNNQGLLVKQESLGNDGKISISSMAAGVYFVEIISNHQSLKASFIKQ